MATPRSAFTLTERDSAVCLTINPGGATPLMLSEFGETLNQMIAREESPRLIVDLSAVEFMPTAMLGHLIAGNTKLRIKGGRIRLVGANSHIAGVFDVTRMKEQFEFHDTVDAAMSSFETSTA